jgi:hypothetical protein
MKNIIILFGLILINFCLYGQISSQNNPKINPRLLNKIHVSYINGRQIDFYLNHSNIDRFSKMYYRSQYTPGDDEITFGFLDSVLTTNKETRPFYFFVFNNILNISDGALSEGIAFKCLDYINKFPCEFIDYLHKDTLVHIKTWIGLLNYTQYNDQNINKIDTIEFNVKKTCPNYIMDWEIIRKKILK